MDFLSVSRLLSLLKKKYESREREDETQAQFNWRLGKENNPE